VKLFGTDGIRGKAGDAPLDRRTVARVGAALVRGLDTQAAGRKPRVLVGRDTRESGAWIEDELTRGLTSQGATTVSVGVSPTPAIAYLTQTGEFDAGIVISASHNPYQDNGIKIFSHRGEKLDEAIEARIERTVADPTWTVSTTVRPAAGVQDPALARHYVEHLRGVLSDAGALRGGRVVIDCAHGATTAVAPALFRDLGFDVAVIGDQPDGCNINLNCGSTHLETLQQEVIARGARLGVAFDGDGDRALFVDARGHTVDGDAVLLVAADHLHRTARLAGNAIVATVMSNIGLEIALGDRGIGLVRAPVGDKYVMEEMQKRRLVLGGEQSGHIIFAEHLFTGDGIGTALQVLRIMAETGRELEDLASALVTYPQVLVNVRVRERADYARIPAIAETIARVEDRVRGQGRVLIRYSGTEPLLRIMLEGRDQSEIRAWADEIAEAVKSELA
jgi:phosphoglucosamine mutase